MLCRFLNSTNIKLCQTESQVLFSLYPLLAKENVPVINFLRHLIEVEEVSDDPLVLNDLERMSLDVTTFGDNHSELLQLTTLIVKIPAATQKAVQITNAYPIRKFLKAFIRNPLVFNYDTNIMVGKP